MPSYKKGYSKPRRKVRKKLMKKPLDEVKFHDVEEATGIALANDNTLVQALTDVTQGDDYNERIGRQIQIKSVKLRLYCRANPSQTEFTSLRILIVVDKSNQDSAPTVANVLQDVGDEDNAAQSHWNRVTVPNRFGILMDKTYAVDADSRTGFNLVWQKTFKNPIVVRYITNASTNAIYLMATANCLSASTNDPQVLYQARITYLDD